MTGRALALALMMFSDAASAQEAGHWHLLTQALNGTVSIVHGLTERQCEFAKNRALGLPATDEEKAAEKRRYATEYARLVAEMQAWEAQHPECLGENPSAAAAAAAGKCWRSAGYSTGVVHYRSDGDTKTAECFE